MTQPKKLISSEKLGMIGIIIGIVLAIVFIVIGSTFFDLKSGPTNSASEPIDASQYVPN